MPHSHLRDGSMPADDDDDDDEEDNEDNPHPLNRPVPRRPSLTAPIRHSSHSHSLSHSNTAQNNGQSATTVQPLNIETDIDDDNSDVYISDEEEDDDDDEDEDHDNEEEDREQRTQRISSLSRDPSVTPSSDGDATISHSFASSSSKDLAVSLLKLAPARPNSILVDPAIVDSMFNRMRSKSALNNRESTESTTSIASLTRKRAPSASPPVSPNVFTSGEKSSKSPTSPLNDSQPRISLTPTPTTSSVYPTAAVKSSSVHDASSAHSAHTAESAESSNSKKKPAPTSYFQKLGFGTKTKPQSQLQPSTSHQMSFKLGRRTDTVDTAVVDGEDGASQHSGKTGKSGGKTTSKFRQSPAKVTKNNNVGYISVRAKNKSAIELSRLKKIQMIAGNLAAPSNTAYPIIAARNDPDHPHIPVTGSILTMKFSNGGKFLATGGADCILRVWIVSSHGSGGVTTPAVSTIPESPTVISQPASPSKHHGPSSLADSLGPKLSRNMTIGVPKSASGHLLGKKMSMAANSKEDSTQNAHLPNFSQFLGPSAHRTFHGHTGPILDLSWSKANFIATASADKTVRLWHLLSASCLKIFAHDTPVSAVRFHPNDNTHFVSGGGTSTHARLRLWNIPEKRVKHWVVISKTATIVQTAASAAEPAAPTGAANVPGSASYSPFITALEFSHDGKLIITGTSEGSLYFHEFNELRYNTLVDLAPMVSTRHFRVTGIESLVGGFGGKYNEESNTDSGYILVTATDSRVRLFNLRDKSLVRRYRGPDISKMGCMRAVGSVDGRFAICGSEDARVYVWDLDPNSTANVPTIAPMRSTGDKGGVPYSKSFDDSVEGNVVTTAVGGKSALSGVFSELMHWDQTRFGQYERFTASDCSITAAVLAPPCVRTLLGLDIPGGHGHLSGAFIVVADVMGNLHVYENEMPFWLQNQGKDGGALKGTPEVKIDIVGSEPEKKIGERRNITLPGALQTSDSLLVESPEEYSPISPTIDGLQHDGPTRKTKSTDTNATLVDVFGGVSKDIYFLPKLSTKKEAPPPEVPQFVISPTADGSLGLPYVPQPHGSRRRSYSAGAATGLDSEPTPSSPTTGRRMKRSETSNSEFKQGSTSKSILGKLRGSSKTVSHSRLDTGVATTTSSSHHSGFSGAATAAIHATGIISGILTRIRGNTEGSHVRSNTVGSDGAAAATNQSTPSSSRASPGKIALVPLKASDSETSAKPLGSKKSLDNLRRGAFQSNHSLADMSPDISAPPSPFIAGNLSTFSLGRQPSRQQSEARLDVDKEDELLVCPHCGSSKFSMTVKKLLICVDCHTKLDA
ncbi:hypothetical protein HDU79_007124 [Rhizoclosmatium sp. JEL0117]|nr:hypothetical protein HDU79_007124 [Rhizoclosmatium sp. JEL0117]